MFNWFKKMFSNVDELPISQVVKCAYDKKYLEEATIALIDDFEIKANILIQMHSDETNNSSYGFAQNTLAITIPLLVKSYEQICIAGESDTVCNRIGRYPTAILNDTLRGLIECTEDMLQGDVIVFQKPVLSYSIHNIIQVEEMLQKRSYE